MLKEGVTEILKIITFFLTMLFIPLIPWTEETSKLLPRKIHGYKPHGKVETYNRQTIYEYMDGAGEIYLAYGFKELLVQRYQKVGEPEIIVEIFDMVSGKDAFGVFTHVQGRDDKEAGIGQNSEYRGGLLTFWKGRFFVSILTKAETVKAKRAVLEIGRTISKGIGIDGEKSGLLNYIREEDFFPKEIRYFHTHAILNYHYYLSGENILNLDEDTDAVLARYKDDGGYLLLVEYKKEEDARKALNNFINAYMPEITEKGIVQTEDGRWTVATAKQNFVIIVLDAITQIQASSKLEAIKGKLK